MIKYIELKHGRRNKTVLLTYDSFASHTTMSRAMSNQLNLKETYVRTPHVQTYGGPVQEAAYQVSAQIVGLKGKIDFLVSNCEQKIPKYSYDIPFSWTDKYNLPASCLLYTSPSPRDVEESRMPSSA